MAPSNLAFNTHKCQPIILPSLLHLQVHLLVLIRSSQRVLRKRMRCSSVVFAICCFGVSLTFVRSFCSQRRIAFRPTTRLYTEEDAKKNNVLDFLLNPYETKIPREMEAEIYRAEGNTPAAQERTKRVTFYGVIAILLVGCAFFNAFLTELRSSEVMDGTSARMSLEELGFGWAKANFLFQFLFLNKIGGGLALISGAATGMLAEAELDSRRKNAERIWEELERRRNEGAPKRKKKTAAQEPIKKKTSGKQAKRLGALSEVVLEGTKPEVKERQETEESPAPAPKTKQEGMMDKLKSLYEKADSMAASQALLLNKKLEDEGILEKITDETGLKVIGKEAASNRKQQEDAGAVDQENPAMDTSSQPNK